MEIQVIEPMEKLLKIEQVSDLLQVSKRTIYDWIHVGYIPHYKFPNGILFKSSDIENWLKKRKQRNRLEYRPDITQF